MLPVIQHASRNTFTTLPDGSVVFLSRIVDIDAESGLERDLGVGLAHARVEGNEIRIVRTIAFDHSAEQVVRHHDSNTIYVLAGNTLVRLSSYNWDEQDNIADNVQMVARSSNGQVYWLSADNKLYHTTDSGEQRIVESDVASAAGVSGNIYWLNKSGELKRLNGNTTETTQSDVAAFVQAADGNLFYQLGKTVYQTVTPTPGPLEFALVWNDVDHLQQGRNGSLYTFHSDGTLKKFDGRSSREWATGILKLYRREDGSVVYQLGNSALHAISNNGQPRGLSSTVSRLIYREETGSIFVRESHGNVFHIAGTSSFSENVAKNVTGISFGSNGDLHLRFADGTKEVTLVDGDLVEFILEADDRETVSSDGGGTDTPGYGIVGPSGKADSLANIFQINALGRIETADGQFGSGTVLAWGGNRYVLTAAHVVEDENGNKFSPAQVKFFLPHLGNRLDPLNPDGKIAVEKVYQRQHFGYRDIALLKLADSPLLNKVKGIHLPKSGYNQVSASDGLTIAANMLAVGYGRDNSDYDKEPDKEDDWNYGLAKVERKGQTLSPQYYDDEGTKPKIGLGQHLVNQVRDFNSEVTIQPGDSGGPYLVRKTHIQTNGDRHAWWEVVGVHSFIDDPNDNDFADPGEETWSLQITSDLVSSIKSIIGAPSVFATFKLHVRNNGDGLIDGAGEWRMRLQVNGQLQRLSRDVNDNITYLLDARFQVDVNRNLHVVFDGTEIDAGTWWNPHDPIARMEFNQPISSQMYYNWFSIGEGHGDTGYELYGRITQGW